ncbi:MAG: hypothetical protein NC411_03270 [Bacteroides sp.]|nr:hypothetical protein [Bacteroides sp.]
MKLRKFLFSAAVMSLFGLGFSASVVTDEPGEGGEPGGVPANPLDKVDGIIAVNSEIGDWDAAYLTKDGYFCFKSGLDKETDSKYNSLSFMAPESTDIVSIISTKEGNIPTQMKIKEGMVYFSFPNDSILELLLDNGAKMEMIDSIAYRKASLPGLGGDDRFKAILANASSLLNSSVGGARPASLGSIASVFDKVSKMPYVTDDEFLGTISKDADGNYTFTGTISEWFKNIMDKDVKNVLTLWTGKATFKVGGSSCTLSGTIWCSSDIFNKYGTYGILCDTDPTKLTVGNAEYQGTGVQNADDLSFGVDFRGFKPNTTYYYRAYYEFNSADHGSLIPKYGSSFDAVFYDTTIKSFTTGDNVLTVDVVMCIDATGSMSGIINTVKRNAIAFYDLFKDCCESEGIQLAALNAQVISFRDKNVDYDWFVNSPTYSLPDQRNEYESFVNGLYASGGGDTPESGLEALDAAFDKTDWGVDDGYHRQVVILWTDAPYLIGDYSSVTLESLEAKWNTLPSGRRLILFAPYGNYDYNGDDWAKLDGWKNLIHEADLYNGFNNFEYILKSIIGELTSKGKSRASRAAADSSVFFRPNN